MDLTHELCMFHHQETSLIKPSNMMHTLDKLGNASTKLRLQSFGLVGHDLVPLVSMVHSNDLGQQQKNM